MDLADKDKLSCPLLLHMIFYNLCTGSTPVKRKKGSPFLEKPLLVSQYCLTYPENKGKGSAHFEQILFLLFY